jgi:DDE superfamily endonuclease
MRLISMRFPLAAGFSHISPRPQHPDQDAAEQIAPGTTVEIWFQDEARIGQKNGLVYQWAKRGSRPRQPKDQRYANAYLFGAICPARDIGAAVVMPYADTFAQILPAVGRTQTHLDEISLHVADRSVAVMLLDQAGWHTTGKLKVPSNIVLVQLPPKSPELNPTENIWQYLRQTWLSSRVFENYTDICTACCEAWNNFVAEFGRIASIGRRTWARIGQCQ